VAHVFASHKVSIQTVRQTGTGDKAELIVMTHSSTESALSATVKDLGKLEAVSDVSSVLRVEGVN
jgi:homoserine dehydrogenase